jgi:hypothetical protein
MQIMREIEMIENPRQDIYSLLQEELFHGEARNKN